MSDNLVDSILLVTRDLNMGKKWDDIKVTKFKEIEQYRNIGISVSEFSRIMFKYIVNSCLTNIYEKLIKNPHPYMYYSQDIEYDENIKNIKHYFRESMFLYENTIYSIPRKGDARFRDC